MSMEVSGKYNYSKINDAIQVTEQQDSYKVQKAKETKLEQTPMPQDEYISSEKSGEKPSGLYRLGQDENGNPKVFFEDPNKSGNTDEKGQPKASEGGPDEAGDKKQLRVKAEDRQKQEEICIGSTDKVDREIRKLKEKKQQLEQQIRSVCGDERKIHKLQKKLEQVESELSLKDNETYRRQHTSFY